MSLLPSSNSMLEGSEAIVSKMRGRMKAIAWEERKEGPCLFLQLST